ncbi:MAG: hypothetical protein IT233_01830 [Bacteroidia bacterium]|nr:hypothetical protein [Bacteroidia bacterium]
MHSESTLWQLIRSLSKPEKSYFRKHRLRGSESYRNLFNAMAASETHKEKAIMKNSGYNETSLFSAGKHYLLHSILDSLLAQDAGKGGRSARRDLERATVLFERSLFHACIKLQLRAKKAALKREDHLLGLECLNLEQLAWQFIRPDLRRDLEEILDEKTKLLENIRFTEHARQLNARMLVLFQTIGVGRTAEQEERYHSLFLEATHILEHPAPNGTITGGVYLLNCLVYYHNVKGDLESSRNNLRALVDLIDAHPGVLPSSFTFYVSSLNNLILVHLYLREFESAERLIRKLNALQSDSIKDKNALFICRFNTGFELFEKMGEQERAYELSEALKEEYPSFAKRLSPVYTGHLLYYAFRACFQTGRFRQAQLWLNEILHHTIEAKPEVMAVARISELLLAYERGNFESLESMVRRAGRHFKRTEGMLKFEQKMLNFFREHSHHEASVHSWSALLAEMETLSRDPLEQKVFMYFDVPGWIRKKLKPASAGSGRG